jgi:hypothetical protein
VKEKQALENSLLDMLLLLKAEEKNESKRRLALLRDRQNRCATGDEEACELVRTNLPMLCIYLSFA